MKYSIKISGKRKKIPVVIFEDKKYDLIGEFLLAERSTLKYFLDALENADKDSETEISGNAFTLTADKEKTTVTCDITDQSVAADTSELKALINDYINSLKS